jgi:hypothetical protein
MPASLSHRKRMLAHLEREEANAAPVQQIKLDGGDADYLMSDKVAEELKGIVLLSDEHRILALERFLALYGTTALVKLSSQFIGLANSVVYNNREMIELLGITQGGDHPYTAEKYNLPTIFGALCGVALANSVDQSKTCPGCAYRRGTSANQSPCTTSDADLCETDGEPDFLCHEKLDAAGKATKLCAGHAQRTKHRRKRGRA